MTSAAEDNVERLTSDIESSPMAASALLEGVSSMFEWSIY
jgi:hypothetical protein